MTNTEFWKTSLVKKVAFLMPGRAVLGPYS